MKNRMFLIASLIAILSLPGCICQGPDEPTKSKCLWGPQKRYTPAKAVKAVKMEKETLGETFGGDVEEIIDVGEKTPISQVQNKKEYTGEQFGSFESEIVEVGEKTPLNAKESKKIINEMIPEMDMPAEERTAITKEDENKKNYMTKELIPEEQKPYVTEVEEEIIENIPEEQESYEEDIIENFPEEQESYEEDINIKMSKKDEDDSWSSWYNEELEPEQYAYLENINKF